MKKITLLFLLAIMPVCFAHQASDKQYTKHYVQFDKTHHIHKPGYFFYRHNGRYYPDYQDTRLFKRRIPQTCQLYSRVFYRYYDTNGFSKEYYIP